MPRIMSQMSEDELDFLYEQALHNESSKVEFTDENLESEWPDIEIDPDFNEPWTAEDEAGLEEFEENRRRRIAERNEY